MVESETRGALIILTGGKAVGKTTLAEAIIKLDPSFERIITYTSRSPRANETDGVDYHFLTPDQFIQKKESGFFFEWVEYAGHFKGTSNDAIEAAAHQQNRLWVIDLSRAVKVKAELPPAVAERTKIFLITTENQQSQLKRFESDLHRKLDKAELASFAKALNEDAEFLSQTEKFDAVIVNPEDQSQQAAQQILKIVKDAS